MFRIKGRTIFDSIRSSDAEALKEFIKIRKDLLLTDGSGNTPLLLALKEKKKNLAELLLASGAGLSQADRDGSTPLMLAMDGFFGNLPEKLFEAGASPISVSAFGHTALSLALQNGRDTLACSILKKNGIDPAFRTKDNWTMLMLAIRHQNPESTKVLLADDRNLQGTLSNGWNLLHVAARYQPDLAASIMTRLPGALNQKSETGVTPLSLIAQYGNAEQLQRMLDAGASVVSANNEGWTPLMFALRYGQMDCAQKLIAHSEALPGRNKDGWQAVHFAARYKPTLLQQIVGSLQSQDRKAALEGATLSGYRPLHLATIAHDASAVRWLLEQGVDARIKTIEGQSAFDLAHESNDKIISEILSLRVQ